MISTEKYFDKARQKVTLTALARLLVTKKYLRRILLNFIDKKIFDMITKRNLRGRPRQVQEDKYNLISALFYRAEQAYQQGFISQQIIDQVIDLFLEQVLLFKDRQTAKERLGFSPPGFITISPGEKCNLKCSGCYAASTSSASAKLDFKTFDRILTEKEEIWGSRFTVISGGEPFLWESEGKDLLDMAARHSNDFFLVYTNGTLINDELAERLVEVGNITPAISVEGFEKETDSRRGRGVHKRIMRAFEALREAGVPFGISITATRDNWDIVTSDEFADFYFEEQNAIYAWLFQYMPIGRQHSLKLMITPEQRLEMFKRMWHLVRDKKVFIADFWNSGTVSDGCISAGRDGGYFYINWNGDITPCVFIPYSCDNIYDIYNSGGTINDILKAPIFQKIRKWQDSYGFIRKKEKVQNWLCPCAIRDHFDQFQVWRKESNARPIDKDALEAINDDGYCQGMKNYGKEYNKLTDAMWDEHYLKKQD
jgi:MoaA/NifB/PqqE/SkfB family radical SAM enzyme